MDSGDAFWTGRSEGWRADKRIPMIDPRMLRFRPIAPKPATGEPVSSAGNLPQSKSCLVGKRAKRRYVRVRKNNSQCKIRSRSQAVGRRRTKPVSTLQFLPEKAEPRESMAVGVPLDLVPMIINPKEVSQQDRERPLKFNVDGEDSWDPTVVNPLKRGVAVSWLTVDRISADPCMGAVGEFFSGSTDEEKMKNLRSDTCPGLVSDFQNRVHWVNDAYVLFASGQNRGEVERDPHGPPPPPEIEVRLVAKERLPTWQRAFTCQVTWRDERWTRARTVPCDVWRLDGLGGFAWRLDVKAALGLGF